jgi:hypothetical protein
MSDPAEGLPAWLQLDWPGEIDVSEVQFVFDTGLHRHLTLSHHDGYTSRMQWGRPQTETVRDYTIQFLEHDDWKQVVEVSGNYQRLRRHVWNSPQRIRALRVIVTGTNGLDHARIMEVRVRSDADAFE